MRFLLWPKYFALKCGILLLFLDWLINVFFKFLALSLDQMEIPSHFELKYFECAHFTASNSSHKIWHLILKKRKEKKERNTLICLHFMVGHFLCVPYSWLSWGVNTPEMLHFCDFKQIIPLFCFYIVILNDPLLVYLPWLQCSVMALDFMVIPRSCSSSRLSMYRILPARRDDMIPLLEMRESANVVLPECNIINHRILSLHDRSIDHNKMIFIPVLGNFQST